MSRFFSEAYKNLEPYVPGEQPKNRKYIKLNTNESPFPPSEKAIKNAAEAAKTLELYSDPECSLLVDEITKLYPIGRDEVIFTNGSDEALNFAFIAYCDKNTGAAFPDITYGFYPVFAEFHGIDYRQIPLKDDFSMNVADYENIGRTIFIANPNAPTGIALSLQEIERIVKTNPDNIVVVDEAYVDFGAQSAVSLIHKYDNLLVVQTFSKSRSMAGARLGFAMGNSALIADLNTIKYSTNPYNVNAVTIAAGAGALSDDEYTKSNIQKIIENRDYTQSELKKLGFSVIPSSSNFVFAKHPSIGGEELYLSLKEKGVLVRHFSYERIKDYIRITIGTKAQMEIFIDTLEKIGEEKN